MKESREVHTSYNYHIQLTKKWIDGMFQCMYIVIACTCAVVTMGQLIDILYTDAFNDHLQ